MGDVSSEEDEQCVTSNPLKSRKRPKHGRLSEVSKKINLQNREQGDSCKCKLKCFERITENGRAEIIKHVNSLKSR